MSDVVSYARKRLKVIYTLGNSTFDDINDTTTLEGLRMSAAISKQGGSYQGALDLRIWGLTQSKMNKMSVLAATPDVVSRNDTIKLVAQSGEGTEWLAYEGTISNAWPDYNAQPDVCMHVVAFGAIYAATTSAPPTSYSGDADPAAIMSMLASKMRFSFHNHGVEGSRLGTPYLSGSYFQQAETVARAAGIWMTIDDGAMHIWPADGYRKASIPLVSPQTGLVGYPTRSQVGIDFRCLYNPAVLFGALVEIESSIIPCCGQWQVLGVDHNLECEMPDGQWFSTVACCPPGTIGPITNQN